MQEYGERLLRVRYRYDALKRKRYTTAEIIVDQSDWDPLPSEVARRLWFLPMEQVLQLGLGDRVEQELSL